MIHLTHTGSLFQQLPHKPVPKISKPPETVTVVDIGSAESKTFYLRKYTVVKKC